MILANVQTWYPRVKRSFCVHKGWGEEGVVTVMVWKVVMLEAGKGRGIELS
jgi:hypothetical protein